MEFSHFSQDVLDEEVALRAVFGDDKVLVSGRAVCVTLAVQDGSLEFVVMFLRGNDYPNSFPDIEVANNSDMSDVHRNALLERLRSMRTELLDRKACFLYDLLMEASAYCKAQADLSGLSNEDASFLRSSVESLALKKELGLDVSIDISKSSSEVIAHAQSKKESRSKSLVGSQVGSNNNDAPVAALSGKRRLCVVCNVQVPKNLPKLNGRFYCVTHRCQECDIPLSNPVSVGGVSKCAAHAHSNSSAAVDVVSSVSSHGNRENNDHVTPQFLATKQLLQLLSVRCKEGFMSSVDLQAVHSVLSQLKFSIKQQDELSSLVSDAIVVADAKNDPKITLDSVNETKVIVSGFAERCSLLPCQIFWISRFFDVQLEGFSRPPDYDATADSAIEEIRLFSQLYAESFLLVPPSYRDRVDGIVSVVRLMIDEPPASLEVFVKFYDAGLSRAPVCDFGACNGFTLGDLALLKSMLNEPALQAFSAIRSVNLARRYVSEIVERAAASKSAAAGEFDFPYACERFSHSPSPFQRERFVVRNMSDLDQIMMVALRDSVNDAKGFDILGVENIVSSTTFTRFRERARQMFDSQNVRNGTCFPVVAWYEASNSENANAIVEEGILAPFDLNSKGQLEGASCGALFGQGIYLSSDARMSSSRGGVKQLFFALVLIGTPQYISEADMKSKDFWFQMRESPLQVKATYDSKVIPSKRTFVVFDADQVLPFFFVTLGPAGSAKKHISVSAFNGKDFFGLTRDAPVDNVAESKKFRVTPANAWRLLQDGSAKADTTNLFAYRIPTQKGQHWLLSIPPSLLSGFEPRPLRLIFVIDRSKSMGQECFKKIVIPACKQLYRTIGPSEGETKSFYFGLPTLKIPHSLFLFFFFPASIILFGSTVDLIGADRLRNAGASFFDKMEVTLESGTNLIGGVERAVDVVMRDLEHIRAQEAETDPTFLIILLSDGKDTVNKPESIPDRMDRLTKMVTGCTAKILFRAVHIGQADTKTVMALKSGIETVYSYEESPITYVRSRRELPKLMQNLGTQLTGLFSARLELDNGQPYEGFVRDVLRPASDYIDIFVRPSHPVCLLLRGPPPRDIIISGQSVGVLAVNEITWLENVGLQGQLLEVLRRHVDDVAIAAVAKREGLLNGVEDVRRLISSVAETVCSPDKLSTPEQRLRLMKRTKTLLFEVRELLNRTQETILLASATSDGQARFLVKIEQLTYGMKALRRALPFDSELTRSQCSALVEQVHDGRIVENANVDLVSVRTRLSTVGHIREIGSCVDTLRTVMDFLFSFGVVGLACRIRRSESCVVDAYAVHVEYVSNIALDTTTAMCFAEAGIAPVVDGDEACRDVLLVGDPRNFDPYFAFSMTTLFRFYHSVCFAGNPALFNPRMPTAVLAVALVRCAAQMLIPKHQTNETAVNLLRIRFTLRARMLRGEEEGNVKYWDTLIAKLSAADFSQHLTEASEDDIGSVAKVLAAMICLSDRLLFFRNARHTSSLFLALMAETSSRGTRIEVKQKGGDEHPLLKRALGITDDSCIFPLPVDEPEPKNLTHSDAFDVAAGKKFSGRFFFREMKLSNCPPSAVVASFGLCKVLSGQALANGIDTCSDKLVEIVKCAMASTSMKTCIADFVLPDGEASFEPVHLQIALYVQGLKFHNSRLRRGGLTPLRHPERVLSELARDVRYEEYQRRLSVKLKAMREKHHAATAEMRLQIDADKQLALCKTHTGLPRCFTWAEADDLGIAINETGLPTFVCSYPACEEYLKPLGPKTFSAKEADKLGLQINKAGVPICQTKGCKRLGKKLIWMTRSRAKRLEYAQLAEINHDFYFICLNGCNRVVVSEGESGKPANRHYLYSHLGLFFHPNRLYAKALHITAKAISVGPHVVQAKAFVSKLLPLVVQSRNLPGENWIDLLASFYRTAIRLYFKGKEHVLSEMTEEDMENLKSWFSKRHLGKAKDF